MQKMIFSTIALVAFSFAGIANEIEEKKVKKYNKIIIRDCWEKFLEDYNKLRDMGFSHENSGYIADKNYAVCKAKKIVNAD